MGGCKRQKVLKVNKHSDFADTGISHLLVNVTNMTERPCRVGGQRTLMCKCDHTSNVKVIKGLNSSMIASKRKK